MAQFINHAMTKTEVLEGVSVDVVRSRMVAKHTAMYWEHDGTEYLRYVQTDVLVRHPDHSIQLFSGGYRGPTTKKRINEYLPGGWQIWQANGAWLIGAPSWHYPNAKSYVFVEGIKLVPEFAPNPLRDQEPEYTVEYPEGEYPEVEQQRVKAITKKINAYVRRVKALSDKKALPMPALGDCLLCQVEEQQDETPKPGEGLSHLESHLDEPYVHGTLVLMALRWGGYSTEQLQYVWGNRNTSRTVCRYLKFRFGISTG